MGFDSVKRSALDDVLDVFAAPSRVPRSSNLAMKWKLP